MTAFDHERLDVYRAAIDFLALADGIVEHLAAGAGYGYGYGSARS